MTVRHKFLRNEEGGVLIFMALAIAVLIIAVGLAIDAGRIFLINSKAQTALDAAVVSSAAVSFQPVDAADAGNLAQIVEERGDSFFLANFPAGFLGVSIGANQVNFTPQDDGTSVRGDLSFSVDTFFGDFAMTFAGGSGLDNVGMDEFAEVVRIIPDIDLEIALVLDYTKSMCEFELGRNCNNSRFANMRESTNLLIDTLAGSLQATSGDSTINYSFIPFTHTVKVNNNVENLAPSVFNGTQLRDTEDSLPNILGLRQDTDAITNALDNVVPLANATSGTNVGVGAFWGWLSLRRNSAGEFVGASRHDRTPAIINDENTYKMMILLTDGENTAWYLRNNGWEEEEDPQADDAQRAACAGAQREGIEIRVIALGNLGANAENLLRECATTRDGVLFFYPVVDTDDAEALREVFREIANDLIDLRISR